MLFSSPGLKGHVGFSHHLASIIRLSVRPSIIRRPSTITEKSSLKPLSQFWANFAGMVLGWSSSKIVSPNKMAARLKIAKRGVKFKKIFSSESTEPISIKLGWNGAWVVLFRNCVRQFQPPNKMAARQNIEKEGMQF